MRLYTLGDRTMNYGEQMIEALQNNALEEAQELFIEALEKDRLKYVQYQLYNFFVEVIYNAKDNEIIGLNSFLIPKITS